MATSKRDASASGVRVLTAEHAGPPDRPCVTGELVWTSDLCDDRPCQCEWGFNGVASDGLTTVARVRHLSGVSRMQARQAMAACMRGHGYPPQVAALRAARLLAIAAALPVDTLLRLERGVPVPFPPGSRMDGPGMVVIPAPGTAR